MNFIRSGFRAIRANPAVAIAEIAWRWAFGFAAWVVLVLTFREILAGVDISRVETAVAQRSDVFRIADALARVLAQVLPRFVHALAVVVPLLALVWIAAATVGRVVTLRALIASANAGPCGEPSGNRRYRSVGAIQAVRALFTVAAFVGFFGTVFAVSAQFTPEAASEAAPWLVLLWMCLALMLWVLWGVLNWFLSLAPIFAVRDGAAATQAIADSLRLYRKEPRDYLAIATAFGLFRMAALVVATLAGFVVLTATSVLGAFLLSIVVGLAYCAVADFLTVARLASYVALANGPAPTVVTSVAAANNPAGLTPYTGTEPQT